MTTVAIGVVEIEVSDAKALAQLAALSAAVEAELAKIDAESAKIDIDADVKGLKKDLAAARAEIKKFKAWEAAAETKAQARYRKVKRAAAEEAIQGIQDQITAREKDLRSATEYYNATTKQWKQAKVQAREAARAGREASKAAREREKADARAAKERAKAAEAEQRSTDRRIADSHKATNAVLRDSERERAAEARTLAAKNRAAEAAAIRVRRRLADDARTLESLNRERRLLPVVEAQYTKLARRVEQLGAARAHALRVRDTQQVEKIDIDISAAQAKLGELGRHIQRVTGGDRARPLSLELRPTLSENFGRYLRQQFMQEASKGNTGLAVVAAAIGADVGAKLGGGIVSGWQRIGQNGLRSVARDVRAAGADIVAVAGNAISGAFSRSMEHGATRLQRLGALLADTTIRLGPFTTTIRKALIGLAVLGPMLVDIVGGLGALVAQVASAALGLGALGIAVVGGAIPAMIGLFTVVKPVIKQFKSAMAATKAYNDALNKNNSKLAAKKLKELDSILGRVDKRTRENFINAGKLRDNWEKLTKPARSEVFKTMGEGLGFASKHMKSFSELTNEGTTQLGRGLRGIMRGFDWSSFASMGGNFNRAIRPVLSGVGNLLNYFTRVGKVASLALAPLGHTFKNWSKGLLEATNNAEAFSKRITGLVDSTRKLGSFLVSAGRLSMTLFRGGQGAGDSFVVTMTRAMDRWNAFLRTTEGQESLGKFFRESVSGVQQLWAALAPVVSTFARWAIEVAPLARSFFAFSEAVGKLTAGLLKITFLRGPLTAMVATLGALWSINKLDRAIFALGRFRAGLLGIETASAAVAAANVAGTVSGAAAAGTAGGATLRRTATSTTTRAGGAALAEGAAIGATAGRVTVAQRAFTGLTTAGTRVAAALGSATAAASLAGGAAAGMGTAAIVASGGLAILGAAAIYGGYKLATMTTASEKLNKAFTDSRAEGRLAGQAFVQARQGGAALAIGVQQAALSVAQARKELKGAKKGTLEYRQAMLNLRTAEQQHAQARQQWTANKEAMESSAQTRFQGRHKAYQKALEKQRNLEQEIANDRQSMMSQGMTREQADDALQGSIDKLKEYNNEVKDASLANREALNSWAAIPANMARQWKGLLPLTGQVEQRLGALSRRSAGFQRVAKSIGVKFESVGDVGRVAASAAKAAAGGVKANVVMKIVADAKNAEDAVRRLRAMRIETKRLRILEKGSDSVMAAIRLIAAQKLTDKQFNIIERGGHAAHALLRKLFGIKVGDKIFDIFARDRASGTLDALERTRLSPKNLDVFIRTHGALPQGGGPRRKEASGGLGWTGDNGATRPSSGQQERAAATAALGGARQTGGGIYGRPTLLVGEEHRSEAVISFNPAYRKRNVSYLQQAADAFGMSITPAAGGKKGKSKAPTRAASTVGRGRALNLTLPPRTRDYVGPVELNDLRQVLNQAKTDYNAFKTHNTAWHEAKPGKSKDAKEKYAQRKRQYPDSDLARLKGDYDRITEIYRKAQARKSSFTAVENRIDTLWTSLSTAAANYPSYTAEWPGHGVKSYDELWKSWKHWTGTRTGMLRTAFGDFDNKKVGKTRLERTAMGQALAKALGESINAQATTPQPQRDVLDTGSVEDLIAARGLGTAFDNINLRYVTAQADDNPDVPTTLENNKEAARAFAVLYRSLLSTPGISTRQRAEIQGQINAYSAEANPVGGSAASATADQQAVIDQGAAAQIAFLKGRLIGQVVSSPSVSGSRLAADTLAGPNVVGHKPQASPSSPGQPASGGSSTNVIFQSYVPPTPNQAQQLAGYVAGGFGAQGGTSSKTRVGV